MKPFLSKTCRDKICMVLKIYREIEKNTEFLKRETGIKCPEGCGMCCLNQNIEAAPIEFYPLSFYLYSVNMHETVFKMLDENPDEMTCVFFNKDNFSNNKWACTMHKLRPLVCRLFGFYGIKDKFNSSLFASCKIIKKEFPEEFKKATDLFNTSAAHMCMHNYYLKVTSAGNDFDNKLLPINKALKAAMEIIGFEISKGFWYNNFPKKLR